ncbi:MAG: glycosyltransferase [bacterium]
MNIFVIPSWFPDRSDYIKGIFIREQLEALSEINKRYRFFVSVSKNFNLPLKKPHEGIKSIIQYFKEDKIVISNLNSNLTIIENAVLSWSDKLNGNISKLIETRFENFNSIQKEFGKIDVIHAHVTYPGGYIAMKLKEEFGVPFIITEHMGPFPFERFIRNGKLTNQLSLPLMNSDRIISVSASQASSIQYYTGRKPVIIPNLVNENIFIPSASKQPKNKIAFLTVTALIESKGIKELLLSAKSSCSRNASLLCVIVGNGIMENYIRKFIVSNGLSEQIILMTNLSREQVVKQFENCDVFILPSLYESFGVSYVEALACGKPVIATDCGGPSGFVNSENGMLVPVGDVNSITEAILYMANNYKKFDPISIRKYFIDNFSREAVCTKIYRLYEEVVNEK